MNVSLRFLPDNVTINAEVGESILEAAQRAGVFIPTGCLMGSCHACEVDIEDGATICACISAVPPGREQLTINLYSDEAW